MGTDPAGLAIAGAIYALSRGEPVDAHNVNEMPVAARQAAAVSNA